MCALFQVQGYFNLSYSCYIASNDTNMGLFCSTQCEQGEERVQGVGILVVSSNYQIVVLGFQTSGPYNGLWSVFHVAKPQQELARDTSTKLANQEAQGIKVLPSDPYIMVEHSTRITTP
jgi:hypothetical protein